MIIIKKTQEFINDVGNEPIYSIDANPESFHISNLIKNLSLNDLKDIYDQLSVILVKELNRKN